MDLIRWIRGQHRGVRRVFENNIHSALSADQMRERPDGVGNSVVWLMWHMARTEDAIVNAVICERDQILLTDGWTERLGVESTLIGTGLGEEEVEDISKRIDVDSVNEYWKTVADESSEWLKTMDEETLERIPEWRLEEAPPIIAGVENAAAASFWSGRTVGFLFGGTVISHGYIHIGEMQSIVGRLGVRSGF